MIINATVPIEVTIDGGNNHAHVKVFVDEVFVDGIHYNLGPELRGYLTQSPAEYLDESDWDRIGNWEIV